MVLGSFILSSRVVKMLKMPFLCVCVLLLDAYIVFAQLMDIYGTMNIIVLPIYTKNATSGRALRRI